MESRIYFKTNAVIYNQSYQKMEDFGISVDQLNEAAKECERRKTVRRKSRLIKNEPNVALSLTEKNLVIPKI